MKKNVLIVDADASVRESLEKVLADAGYGVTLAADVAEAGERFAAGPPDLLLLDIGLLQKDAWDKFERLTSKAPDFPIIITTGNAHPHDMAVAAGVGALLEKPFEVIQLLKMMQELLAEPEESRRRRLRDCREDVRFGSSVSASS